MQLVNMLKLIRFRSSSLGDVPIQALTEIVEKKPINHDSYIYRLRFLENQFQLRIGQHLRISETIKTYQCPQGEEVVRKYTPITPCSQKQYTDILIKIYRPNSSLQFPNGGKLTPYLESLNVGDKLRVEGPLGKFSYEGGGNITINGTTRKYKRIFLMAGGTGITPCYQVVSEIAKIPEETIDLVLIFGNKRQEDILLRKQLDELSHRIKLHYILEYPPQGWAGFKGYVTDEILTSLVPLDDPDTLYIHCGPFGMNKWIKELFQKKYPNSKLFKF